MLCRFRTYFPDAYKEHYPNARTHLSSKVRSTLPDGSSLFEKTRSKKRRPFSEEEDRALKAGYEKHGTVWAAIVKDPIFKGQGRRSTDLRDRFRNAFPELYQAAGYKPRNSAKKKLTVVSVPVRAATDDQLAMSTTGPVRSRRRSHTNQGLLRGGTKSVPQSTAVSEDEDSSGGEDETTIFKTPHTPVLVPNVPATLTRSRKSGIFDDEEMDMVTLGHSSDPHSIPDFLSSSQSSVFSHFGPDIDGQSQTWSSGINTPTHSMNAWSTAGASPTSSHTDYLASSATQSPSFHRRSTDPFSNFGMIGKSAWGTQDWFSANPRLDAPSASTSSPSFPSSTGASHADGLFSTSPTSGSPFSFSPPTSHAHTHALNLTHLAHHIQHSQGVLDRYDLHPSLFPHDFASEVGDAHSSTFSDEMFPPPSGFRGFTHHSNYAGDLIFGARTLGGTGNPHATGLSGFGFGAVTSGAHTSGTSGVGLGLSGGTGIHPMALSLPGIDEIELTGISLDDDVHNTQNVPHHDGGAGRMVELDDSGIGIMVGDLDIIRGKDLSPLSPRPHPEQGRRQQSSTESSSGGEEVVMMSASPVSQREPGSEQDQDIESRFTLDDLVDLSAHEVEGEDIDLDPGLHATPPATPLLSHSSRSLTRLGVVQGQGYHGRSISVPPSSDARGESGPASSQLERKTSGRRKKVAFGQRDEDGQTQDAMALDLATTNTMTPVHGRSRGQRQTQPLQPTPASAGVAEAPPPRSAVFSRPILHPSSPPPGPVAAAALSHYPFRSGTSMAPGDIVNLNLSFLDLHYHYQVVDATMNVDGLHGMDPQSLLRQGQALDLASTYTAGPSPGLNTNANSGVPLTSKALGVSSAASLRQQVLQPLSDGRVGHGRSAATSSFGMAGGVGGRPVMKGVHLPRTPRSHSTHPQVHPPYQPLHQRRQSAVCPQDLVLRSGDNKRKRASWDGPPT